MKITIPQEYQCYFKGKIYVSRWKDGFLLIMNEDDSKRLKDKLGDFKNSINDGLIRFIQFGVVEVTYKEDILNIPDTFANRLSGSARIFTKQKLGISIN